MNCVPCGSNENTRAWPGRDTHQKLIHSKVPSETTTLVGDFSEISIYKFDEGITYCLFLEYVMSEI